MTTNTPREATITDLHRMADSWERSADAPKSDRSRSRAMRLNALQLRAALATTPTQSKPLLDAMDDVAESLRDDGVAVDTDAMLASIRSPKTPGDAMEVARGLCDCEPYCQSDPDNSFTNNYDGCHAKDIAQALTAAADKERVAMLTEIRHEVVKAAKRRVKKMEQKLYHAGLEIREKAETEHRAMRDAALSIIDSHLPTPRGADTNPEGESP